MMCKKIWTHIIVIVGSITACLSEPSTSSHNITLDDVIESIQSANIAPDQEMLADAMKSSAYIAFAQEFEAKGYIAWPRYAVDLGTSADGTIYILPFETGSNTRVAATAFIFDGKILVDVSAAEYPIDDINAGIVYSYDGAHVNTESLNATFRDYDSWWSCFWRTAGAGCLGAASCYWAGPGLWACVAIRCGANAAWWAVACL